MRTGADRWLGGDAPDEHIACQAFSFDTGLKFRRIWGLILVDSKFDLYLSAANDQPEDPAAIAARRTSRRSIVALMFDQHGVRPDFEAIVMNGHDTADIARKVVNELRLPAEGRE